MDDMTWPGIPAELKYVEIRLPGTFRELLANRSFTDDEIGKIIRCIALDTDFFVTPKIEPEVFYYRRHQIKKSLTRKRVEAYRERKNGATEAGRLTETRKGDGVTVTQDAENVVTEPIKNPPSPKENNPPIVPPKEKSPSPITATAEKRKTRTRREVIEDGIQRDLFSLAAGDPNARPSVESPESWSGGSLLTPNGSGGSPVGQDIGSAPGPVLDGSDTRDDSAWIPVKFATFWNQYPKKVAKRDAVKAFTKLIKVQTDVDKFMETLLSSLSWWKGQDAWRKDGGKFIPYPATWLNGGHWEDIKDNEQSSGAEFLKVDSESDDELLRRMQGG